MSVIATCGHELTEKEGFTKEGSRAIDHPTLCDKCVLYYRKQKRELKTKKSQVEWLNNVTKNKNLKMKPQTTTTDLTTVKIQRLIRENLNDREFRKELNLILASHNTSILCKQKDRINQLEKEVNDYRTLKKLLK